ncbi:hypothetical protein BH11PSE7_BH11PSE7_30630 [soil metagenome]
MPLHDALNLDESSPMRFVPQTALPLGKAYEAYIFETRCCPTRDNLHDFFNGLCWMRFPLTKLRLNALQAEQISAMGVRPQRGPVRDALTLFDENAAFLQAPPALWDALVAKDWQRLFIGLRPLWQQAQVVPFGHALLEKLVTPRKPVTAHVYMVQASWATLTELDAQVAASLSEAVLAAKPFAPLPVLGIPGWWQPNENTRFYDDPQVFRAPTPACL